MNMKKEKRKSKFGILLELLLVSLKTGLFSFGGGYAMIALLESELVAKRNWLEKDEFLDRKRRVYRHDRDCRIDPGTYRNKLLDIRGL